MFFSAYWMTVVNQRWLGIRLDFLGALLTLAVALLTVGIRFSISPGQTGVTLSYIVMMQQVVPFVPFVRVLYDDPLSILHSWSVKLLRLRTT